MVLDFVKGSLPEKNAEHHIVPWFCLISSSLTNQGMPWFLWIFYSDNSVIINSDNSALSQICPIVISTCLLCCRSMAPMSWTCAVDLVARCSSAIFVPFFLQKNVAMHIHYIYGHVHMQLYIILCQTICYDYILYYIMLYYYIYIYYLSPQIWVHTYHM